MSNNANVKSFLHHSGVTKETNIFQYHNSTRNLGITFYYNALIARADNERLKPVSQIFDLF
jgi:hypothetical protein